LFGLDDVFLNSSDMGGGVIQVRFIKILPQPNADRNVKTTAHDSLMTAMVGARSLYKRNHPGVKTESMIIYTTTQTHSLAAKAGLVFGIRVRRIDVKFENRLSLRGEALRKTLEEDIQNGLHPFILGELLCYAVYCTLATCLTAGHYNSGNLGNDLFRSQR
jgi:aromatic-L-amino-acid decarboxylase